MSNEPKNSAVRAMLLQSAEAVLRGVLTPQEANAIANLVAEVHKNKKLELAEQLINSGEATIHQELEALHHAK